MGVSSGKRSRLGASTHLHQATGFVTAANLRLGQTDILHNITVAPKSASHRVLACFHGRDSKERAGLTGLRFVPD
jgi:hypothetical protein